MQEKYEDMISSKDFEIKQIALDKNRMQDSLQTEINFFKREVARLAKATVKNTDELD
jgi:hypothetical protein